MTAINILLAVFGLVGTLSAFGGETWRRVDLPLLQRVTKRGWLSLTCIVCAFTLGIVKEITIQNEKRRSAEENLSLVGEIKALRDSLLLTTSKISSASVSVQESVEKIGSQQFSQLEDAFRLAANIPREYDDCVVHLKGESSLSLPGRHGEGMELYWGDTFEFTIFPEGYEGTVQALSFLKLIVDGTTYDLHPGTGSVFLHSTVRIYGSTPRPMFGRIENPEKIRGIGMKIFVKSTDATRGQEEFRKLVLRSQFTEYAKKVYKRSTTASLRLRATPSDNGSVRSTITKGAFVRVLQLQDSWAEVITPEGRQGWVKSEFLGMLE